MSAAYRSSKGIRTVIKNGQKLTVEYVDKTTAWVRPSDYPAQKVKDEFVLAVKELQGDMKPGTTRIAMKESQHQSPADKRRHFTAYELNDDNKVLGTRHIVHKQAGNELEAADQEVPQTQ